ncbi:hypothetical protein MLD38_000071 [Melastoma candidum]|uniref:Uncharacterized protein n=1 Tax=Melastoma candidum TaxID=119954 RepID=A0ACB9S9B9_9MYRT|nr:hypothetical protein MLD38_000071 [Melastoma candidum]
MLIEKHEKECPQELKEVVSSLIFAASRCGELPELHEIRGVATKLYGKEFTAQAVELCSGCGVNPMIMRRLSMRAPSLERRMEVLGEIASQNGITLQSANTNKETQPVAEHEEQPELKSDISQLGDDDMPLPAQSSRDTESSPEVTDSGMAYQDAVVAAQDAFLSAAVAEAAA